MFLYVLQEDVHDIGEPEVSEILQEDLIRELVKQRILARLKQTPGGHQTAGETSNQGDLRQGVVFLCVRVSIQGKLHSYCYRLSRIWLCEEYVENL